MRCAIVAVALLLLAACSHGDDAVQARLSYWQAEVSRGIPMGANRAVAEKWASDRRLQSTFNAEKSALWTRLEVVPVSGLKYPCSEWVIYLTTHIDSSGRVDHNEISPSGRCV
jgi:hypothetical protein